MKYIGITLAAAMFAAVSFGAQSTTLDGMREVRDPVRLKAWLEANAADAETRVAAIEAGTATVTLDANKILVGNDASNKTAMAVTGDVTITQDGTNVTTAIAADTIGAAERADGDLGDVSVSGGVVSIDAGVVDPAAISTALADEIPYVTVTGADAASAGTGTITIQAKDAAGNNLSEVVMVRTWIGTADDYGADALTDYSVSTGTQIQEVTANAHYLVASDTNGVVVMAVDNGGAATNYAWAVINGKIEASGAVAFTAP